MKLWISVEAKNPKIPKLLIIFKYHTDTHTYAESGLESIQQNISELYLGGIVRAKNLSGTNTQFSWHATFHSGQSPENVVVVVPSDKINGKWNIEVYWNDNEQRTTTTD